MKQIPIFIVASLLILFCPLLKAEFQIQKPCMNDTELDKETGTLHKFYASMLAFNSQPPRCLHNTPIIENTDVEAINLSNDPVTNDVIVDIILNDTGKTKFAQHTSEHIEEEVALMVDKKILVMLELVEPITSGVFQIRGLWYEDAVRLANSIQADNDSP